MGIGIQSEFFGEVAGGVGHGLDIHAVLQGNGGEDVPGSTIVFVCGVCDSLRVYIAYRA